MDDKDLEKLMALLREQGREPQLCEKLAPVMEASVICGKPTELGDYGVTNYLPLPLRNEVPAVVVRVHGDSMIEAGLIDGDYVVVMLDGNASDGDIVAVMLDNKCCIKVLAHDDDGGVWLVPRKEGMEPICIEDGQELLLIGRVTNVLTQPTPIPGSELRKTIRQAQLKRPKRGRPKGLEIRDITSPEHLQRLHKAIDGRRGKEVAQIVRYACDEGWFSSVPKFPALQDEFGDIGSRQVFSRYFKLRMTLDECRAVEKALSQEKST